jgi:hypothetical protein
MVAYRRFQANPFDPELKFKQMNGHLWSVRIPDTGYRALGIRDGNTITWKFIGDHDAYLAAVKSGWKV